MVAIRAASVVRGCVGVAAHRVAPGFPGRLEGRRVEPVARGRVVMKHRVRGPRSPCGVFFFPSAGVLLELFFDAVKEQFQTATELFFEVVFGQTLA